MSKKIIFAIGYVAFHIAVFLYHKHIILKNEYRHINNKKLNEKFYPFVRPDLNNIHVIWSLPHYLKWGPIMLIHFFGALFLGLICIVFGKRD